MQLKVRNGKQRMGVRQHNLLVLQGGEKAAADTNGTAAHQEETASSTAGVPVQDSAQSLAQPSNGDPLTAASAPGHDRHAEPGGDNGNGSVASAEELTLLGRQTLDLWMNLCLCHTLIVEDVEKGQPTVYQVTHTLRPQHFCTAKYGILLILWQLRSSVWWHCCLWLS